MKCTKCDKETKCEGFATYRHRDGRLGRRGVCKGCRGEYAIDNFERLKEWRKEYNIRTRSERNLKNAARRDAVKKYVDEYKANNPCVDCGNYFHPVAMDFDHVGKKNKGVAILVSAAYKLELVIEEIKLCELVCACCHRVRTHTQKHNSRPKAPWVHIIKQ